ncbi:20303_t:CDS:1 [Cetraspora pellucida]|uniref:20303_t:CDS:1 n=1 Tax=Cetraspora pellucida TaxID=1433469 RepID=A0A9N9PJW3_9GLOM|nr:20303_t:CDS:1 [Cetraspora pellucida]
MFGNQRIHTPANQANITDSTPTNEQSSPTLHLMTNNKAKQNDKQSKNAEEKVKWTDIEYQKFKNIKILKELIPYSLKEQEILLKKQVERNQQRNKLIGITCNGNWVDIVRTALATDSNLLQIFLEYKEPKGTYKNEQIKKYMMVQNSKPNYQEDDNIIQGNRKIGLKMILHTSMGLYLNDPLWNNGKRHWKINRILEEIYRADKIGIK